MEEQTSSLMNRVPTVSVAPSVSVSIPRVVKFGYNNFRAAKGKWTAVCKICQKTLSDMSGVSTSFFK